MCAVGMTKIMSGQVGRTETLNSGVASRRTQGSFSLRGKGTLWYSPNTEFRHRNPGATQRYEISFRQSWDRLSSENLPTGRSDSVEYGLMFPMKSPSQQAWLSQVMRMRFCLLSVIAISPPPAVCAGIQQSVARNAAHFEQHVRPILAAKCLKCHGPKKQEGRLRLDSRAAMLRGGDSGPAIVAGKPADRSREIREPRDAAHRSIDCESDPES